MKLISSLFVAFFCYFILWFIVRNMVAGLDPWMQNGAFLLVVLLALIVGFFVS